MKTDKHNQLLSEIGALRDKVEEALRHADERTHAAENTFIRDDHCLGDVMKEWDEKSPAIQNYLNGVFTALTWLESLQYQLDMSSELCGNLHGEALANIVRTKLQDEKNPLLIDVEDHDAFGKPLFDRVPFGYAACRALLETLPSKPFRLKDCDPTSPSNEESEGSQESK